MAKNQNSNPQGLTPEEVKELAKLYQNINNLNKQAAQTEAEKVKNIKKGREELERLRDIMNDYINNIGFAETQFSKMVDGIKGYTTYTGKAAVQFDKLRGIAAKIHDIQTGVTLANEKDLKKLHEKLESEKNRFKTIQAGLKEQLKNQAYGTEEYLKTRKALESVNKILNDNNTEYAALLGAIKQEEAR